uniref:Uncharacterized protein n=1 Tax=Arundo donax TaxID=35708 RepID=A0A0A8XP28_ARUDO
MTPPRSATTTCAASPALEPAPSLPCRRPPLSPPTPPRPSSAPPPPAASKRGGAPPPRAGTTGTSWTTGPISRRHLFLVAVCPLPSFASAGSGETSGLALG